MGTAANGEADLVFVGGTVYTVDAARRWAQAVAVRNGRIVAVGTHADVREIAGPHTEIIDLGGRMLLPGFQDAHAHPLSGGLERLQCDLTEASAADDYLALIRSYAREHPDASWIVGAGWSMAAFPGGMPSADELDAVVGDRPVFLYNRDHHGAWVNSAALEVAGITRDTPDPEDGRIERTEAGDALGTLQEGAMDLVARLAPPPTEEELRRGLIEGQAYLHSLGVTAWQDAIVGAELHGLDTFPIYKSAAESRELTARVVGALWWPRDADETLLSEFKELRERAGAGRFRADTIKFMQDGVCENFTAGMIDPFLDDSGEPGERKGLSFFDPEALKRYVTVADRDGFQVHIHAIGDRAVREALDAIEAAVGANGMNDNRHHIAHIQVIHPDDLSRFRELGVVANGQPLWACRDSQMRDLTIPFLGPERASRQYPFGSLVARGAPLAFGSDWPVSSPDPLAGIHVAVNRTGPPWEVGPNLDAEPLFPEQAIDLATAIAAYTMGSAYVNHLERDTGSIEVGKLADLVVLDGNLFDRPPEEIAGARAVLTLVEGRVVYDDLTN